MVVLTSRSAQLTVLALAVALGMTESRSSAQTQPKRTEKAPMPAIVPAKQAATIAWPAYHPEFTYVSKGRNPKKDWGTFRLKNGSKGTALYLLGGKPVPAELEFMGIYPSIDAPLVSYSVYKEATSTRLWAFQLEWPTINGFVVYTKEKGSPQEAAGWEFYDFADKYSAGYIPPVGIPAYDPRNEPGTGSIQTILLSASTRKSASEC